MSDAVIERAKLWLAGRPADADVAQAKLAQGGWNALPRVAATNDNNTAAVPSAAAIAGRDGADAARRADAALKSAGGPQDDMAKILIANPILGATSVMDLALKRSKFNPLLPATPGNNTCYLDYVHDIAVAPFFHLNYADQKTLNQSTSDWDTLINDIVSLFEGIAGEDQSRIVNGLKQLAHSATSTSNKREEMNVFSQQAISVNSTTITVGIYHSSVSMIEDKGKHTTRQSDFVVNRAFLTFYTEMMPVFAPIIAAAKVTGAFDWLKGSNSL